MALPEPNKHLMRVLDEVGSQQQERLDRALFRERMSEKALDGLERAQERTFDVVLEVIQKANDRITGRTTT